MSRFLPYFVAVLALGLSACEKPQIKTYRVQKPVEPSSAPAAPAAPSAPDANFTRPAPVASQAAASPATAPGATAQPPAAIPGGIASAPAKHQLDWSAPATWQAQPERPMRRATYTVNGAELAVTSFPGDVGGLAANINRWRTQLALPSLPPEEAVASAEKLTIDGREAYLVNISGTGSGQMAPMGGGSPAPAPAPGAVNRTLGLILPYPDETWFFKLGGPDAAVAALETEFRAFVATIHEHSHAQDHPSHASSPASTTPPSTASTDPGGEPRLAIHIPPGWTASPEKRAFRLATITIPAADPAGPGAELAITALKGPSGSLEENAERWYGELKSPAITNPTSLRVQPVPSSGPLKIRLLDLSAPTAEAIPSTEGLLVGIVEYGDYSWFCKLKGPANLVESQRAVFIEFLGKLALE